jgi:hypothetical protein
VWAKRISNSTTAMACAACIATAATLPVMGTAAEQLAKTVSVKLSALSDIDAFSALGATSLADIDAFSALGATSLADIDAFSALGATSLADIDAFSAIPVFRDVATAAAAGDAQGVAIALGGYDALSAVDTFFGDGPVGADGETPVGAVFGSGGIDALAPNADSGGGYAALSALPVFLGSNAPNTNFGPGVFNPAGGLSALSNYDALSAIPAYLNLPPNEAPPLPTPEETSTPTTGSGPVRSLVNTVTSALPGGGTGAQSPQSFAPQAVSAVLPTPKADNSGPALNITRDSKKFTPELTGNSPILLESGTGVDNGIRGWGSALKKLGIGGGEESSSGTG